MLLYLLQKNTVARWVNRFNQAGTLDTYYSFCHRPRKTNPEVDLEIAERVHNQPFITVSSLTAEYEISYSTIRRRLRENGLYHYIPAYQTQLTPREKEARVEFAEMNYGIDWDFVFFSDEKTFKSFNDRAMSLWRPKNQRYNPKYIQEKNNTGRITCGVWGYITRGGVGEIAQTTAHLASEEYTSILEEVYLPSMNITYGQSMNEFTFQQDNARFHTSYFTRAWFATHPEIIQMVWPTKIPDLNPIENVWARMVWNWPNGGFANRENIFQEAEERWEALRGTEYTDHLYDLMTTRLNEVIQTGGNWCSY